MCLIVVKNSDNASFSVQDFRASFTRNNDGTGIMYIDNGRIVVEKAIGALKNHIDMYYKHMHKKQFILHHRFATQGEKTELNIHPFKVLSIDDGDPYDLYFAHNGMISMQKFSLDAAKNLSDTHLFALEYLQPMMKQFPNIIENPVFQKMLHDFIGTSNKLAFLRSDGAVWIFNKSQGEEHNGCWLSNGYSIKGEHNTKNYGKSHGTASTYSDIDDYYGDFGDYDSNYGGTGYGYSQENGVWRKDAWREDWNSANSMKQKSAETMTQLSINEILEACNEYAGLPLDTLEGLFIDDPHVVYDMINLLTVGEVKVSLLNEPAEKVAEQLNQLLQGYAKKLAA